MAYGLAELGTRFLVFIILVALWDAVWKLIAMYRAGFNRQKVWFVFLAILNTAGILPIIYIFGFQRSKR